MSEHFFFAEDQAMREKLRKPFPKEQVGKIPASKGRPSLDYVGHAAVTDRLNAVAPDWTYTIDQVFEHPSADGPFWVRGTMTIGGVSRPEYGNGNDPKDAIGNFIRRGAMRFGVALDLWSREELQQSGAASDEGARTPAASATENGEPGTGSGEGPRPGSPDSGLSTVLKSRLTTLYGSPRAALAAARAAYGDDLQSIRFLTTEQAQELILAKESVA